MKRIKVLIVHQDGLLTGSAISLKYLLMGLDKDKFQLKVLLASSGPAKELFESLGIEVDVLAIKGFWTAPGPKWYRWGSVRNIVSLFPSQSLRSYLHREKPDLIHLNDKSMMVVAMAAKDLKIPVIQHLRSTYQATNTGFFVLLSKWIIKKYATFLIGISEDEASEFEDFPNRTVVYNTMDFDNIESHLRVRPELRQEFRVADTDVLVTFVGMFSKTKGAWDFLDMVQILNKDFPKNNWKFILVGTLPRENTRNGILKVLDFGSDRITLDILENKIKQSKNGNDNLILTGYRKDVLNILAASDIAVLCNRLGAMGRQAFESMSVGTPLVITAGHSGKSTVVKHMDTALVVEPENPSALAQAVVTLTENSEIKRMLGEKAKQYAREHFDYRKNSAKIGKLYNDVIASYGGRK